MANSLMALTVQPSSKVYFEPKSSIYYLLTFNNLRSVVNPSEYGAFVQICPSLTPSLFFSEWKGYYCRFRSHPQGRRRRRRGRSKGLRYRLGFEYSRPQS